LSSLCNLNIQIDFFAGFFFMQQLEDKHFTFLAYNLLPVAI